MAVVVAQANGNFSAGATWVGGVKPQSGDIAETGNFTVTIDEDFTGTLRPTGSGRFDVTTGGITITGDVVMQSTSYTSGGLRCMHTTGEVTLTGTATGGAGGNTYGAVNSSTGTLNVGTATGGAGGSAHGAVNNAAGTLNVGTAMGGAGGGSHGANNGAAGTLNVGTATGGAGSAAYGAINGSTGTLNVGTATGGAGYSAYGAYNNAAGTLICDLAIGSNWGVGGSGAEAAGVRGSGASGQATKVKRIQFGPYGATPVSGAVLIEPDANNSAQFRTAYNGGTLTLVDATADFPAVSDVRYGVQYDNGDKVGAAYIPHPNDVAYGVPVDNTVGVAVLTATAAAAAIWDAERSGHDDTGTFGATGEWAGNVDEASIAAAVLAAMIANPPPVDLVRWKGADAGDPPLKPAVVGRMLDVDEDGNASADVALWKGATPGDLDDDGNVPTVANIADAAAVWAYPTRTLTQHSTTIADSTTAGSIVRRRGDSWSLSLTVGSVTGYTSLWFTVKRSTHDTDGASIIQIKKNATPGGDGLLVANGALAANALLAGITVVDASAGALTIAVDETVTRDIAPGEYRYDVQSLVSGTVATLDSGKFTVVADVTRSVA